ncbi:MAG: DEAD/DEAH box helicase [Bacteroidetes bacterium]|nr:MAG: DEAD/DEAH box helicase [Bacteroidota bacterium]
MTFNELGLRQEVLRSIEDLGFDSPTPIQEKAIPYLLQSESDFVGLAQTGTGKTAAFGLPLISNISSDTKAPQGLVICPTRELCLQISGDMKNFAKYDSGISIVPVYGGTDIKKQITAVKKASVIVATPGRLVDLIKRKAVRLGEVECVVLDEADEMLNMGFKEDIDYILNETPSYKNVWLFSATMPKEVARIAKNYMENPLEVSIGHKNQSNENIDHVYFSVKEKDRYAALKRLIDFNPNIFGLVFCRTRRETQSVAEKLGRDGYNAEPLHGDLSQAQRDNVMNRFRNRTLQLLVATDVAARGIDVDDISHVINYNLPDDIENYTHRSGRTARAGKQGESLVLINTKEKHKIKAIEKQSRVSFSAGAIPHPEDICAVQLSKLIQRIQNTKVDEDKIARFLPGIMSDFESLSKEEVIKKIISAEFNRFIEYYERAGDLNANSDDKERKTKKERKSGDHVRRTRFFVNMGKRDGLNPGGLLRLVCDETGLKSDSVGRIDVMPSFSFFEVDESETDMVLNQVNGSIYEGKKVSIEVTDKREAKKNHRKRERPSRGGRHGHGHGNSNSNGKGKAKGKRQKK